MAKQETVKKEVAKKEVAKKPAAKSVAAKPAAAAGEQGAAASSAVLNIGGVPYNVDSLSRNAKILINNIRVADRELKRLEAQAMLARIARQALSNSLSNELAAAKA